MTPRLMSMWSVIKVVRAKLWNEERVLSKGDYGFVVEWQERKGGVSSACRAGPTVCWLERCEEGRTTRVCLRGGSE